MSLSTSNTHLLVFPFPASSHVIPLLDLVHLLLRRGLTITVTISDTHVPLLEPLLSLYPSSLHMLVFSDQEIISSSSPHPLIANVISTQKQFDPIVQWFESHPSPPVAILSNFLLGWTSELASHLGIKRIIFYPSGALDCAIVKTLLWPNMEEINDENFDKDENFLLCFHEIPNKPEFPWWQLPEVWQMYKKGEQDLESFRKGMLANLTCWGILYNTFEELEGVYIDHMKKQMGHNRVWAVGPLLPNNDSPIAASTRGGSSVVSPDNLLKWLDKKPDDSVVYICFGSFFTLSEKQISALVDALEISNIEFVLCVTASDFSSISSGFEDRVAGRGFIVNGWAPQLEILRHRAVGSFVSHCGWNSALEGASAGVVMLTWPLGADQFTNASLLVDQLGVGKRVCDGGPESVPDSVQFARLLEESLSGDSQERIKMKKLSQAATKAVEQGTSTRDLDTFVKVLSEI